MSTEARMRLIRGHLEAVTRGRSPTGERIGVWFRELESIPDGDLDAVIREARAHHNEACDRGRRWGQITPDDVLAVWRLRRASLSKSSGGSTPPESLECPLGCESGQVLLIGSDGYEFVTTCSCESGDWWAERSPLWASMTRAGAYLENPAFKLARPKRERMPRTHIAWLEKRAEAVGHRAAMREYVDHVERAKEGREPVET